MRHIFSKLLKKHIKPASAALLVAVLLLSGCGSNHASDHANIPPLSAEQATAPDRSIASDAPYYRITEKSIPDPKTEFENSPENCGKNLFFYMSDSDFENSVFADVNPTLSLEDSFSADGRLCFLYSIVYILDDDSLPCFTGSYCLCVLDSPYEQWCFYTFSASCWESVLSDSSTFIPLVRRIVGVSDAGFYLYLSSGAIGFYDWDGNGRLLEEIKIKSNPNFFLLYMVDETLYAVSTVAFSNSSFTSYDEQLMPVLTQDLESRLSGCISRDSEHLWYGFDEDENLSVWDKPNGTKLCSLGNMVSAYSDFLLTKSAAGEFILADVSGIWTGTGKSSVGEDLSLKKILSLAERGYILQELLALSANEDGSVSLVVRFEDNLFLLTLEQTDTPDRQEITLVSTSPYALSNVVAAFNRQSDKYRVILLNAYETGDIAAYRLQLQLEISAGRGPDLAESWVIDLTDCIENGYIEPLDDIIEDPSEYWSACLETGKTDGVLYGIPIGAVLNLLVTSKSLAGGLEAWNLEQMVDAVQKSSAESLQKDFDSLDIVLEYGLIPRDNPQFIDYEAGVSHLAEQPFIDFLEFAKKYGDNLYYTAESNYSETADYYLDGRLAVHPLTMYDPGDLLFVSACFQGQEVLIGMPSAQGRGVYMASNSLCLNSNSQHKDGAKEFLRYLMSAEGQLLIYQTDKIRGGFSCRRDVTEIVLKYYQENAQNNAMSRENLGVRIKDTPLSDEQIDQFRALFENARPEWPRISEICNIACEELEPYFAGDYSAEEAAVKLNNRVQLYFDEHK